MTNEEGSREAMKEPHRDRAYWLRLMFKVADPVLTALSERKLRQSMPVEAATEQSVQYTHLEAIGRLLTGISPWLEARGLSEEEEERRRNDCAAMAREALDAATDPASPDAMNFERGRQPIVDAAFLAHAVVRAPTELWAKLDRRVKDNLIRSLKATRTRKPAYNNWLLFGAMIETALCLMESDWDPMRIDYALRQHERWYKGDGIYGDGPEFHWDYYNSYVIHPMLIDIVETMSERDDDWRGMRDGILQRASRYAAIQERLISPEGTFPAIGRSLAYRCGAFQLLSQMALRRELPEPISPAQVRCALTAVLARMMEAPGTFDGNGWLTIGFSGHQPGIGEHYISTGSLYLCSAVFLPLGLPGDDPFWQGEEDWTSRKLWRGEPIAIDKAYKE